MRPVEHDDSNQTQGTPKEEQLRGKHKKGKGNETDNSKRNGKGNGGDKNEIGNTKENVTHRKNALGEKVVVPLQADFVHLHECLAELDVRSAQRGEPGA